MSPPDKDQTETSMLASAIVGNEQSSNWHKGILDSALVLTMLSAMCFIVGYIIDLRDSRVLGLPHHLLPEVPIQAMILTGGVALIFCFAFGLLLVLLGYLVSMMLRESWQEAIREFFASRFKAHPMMYSAVGVVGVAGALVVLPLRITPMRPSFHDEALPQVMHIDTPVLANTDDLLYLCTRDEFIVLKNKGKKSFHIIKLDSVDHLEISRASTPVSSGVRP